MAGGSPKFQFDGRAAFLYFVMPDGRMPMMLFLDGMGDEEATAVDGAHGKVFVARDDKGSACNGTVKVCVPHDRRPGATCGDDGALFDSTTN